jgi:aromatic-L-amino-acid decarboxylase
MFISHTRLHGRIALRFAIGNIRTDEAHVRAAWERLREAGEELARAG